MDLRHASALAIGAVKVQIESSAAKHIAEMRQRSAQWASEHADSTSGAGCFVWQPSQLTISNIAIGAGGSGGVSANSFFQPINVIVRS